MLRSPNCVGERRLPEECTLLLFCLLDSVIASYAPVVSGGAVWMLLSYGTMISSRRSCISNAAPLRHQSKAMPFMIVTTTSP